MKFVHFVRKYWKNLLLFLVIATWFFVLSENKSLLYQFLYNNRLVPIKDRFTELYFENDQNLPKFIEAYKEQRIQFTIHNLEGADEEYYYQVVYSGAKSTRTILGEKLLVKNNERKIIDVPLFFPQVVTGTISIILPDKNQAIRFIVRDKKK